ncbi:MAG: hypothetical protein WCV67_15885 [Victivallaceae bacterium]|jgi:hypothetical protein
MIFEKFGIEIDKISYEIEMTTANERRLAVITPVLDISSPTKRMLVASLKVDGHELLPSDKVEVRAGRSQVRLRQVRIFNPLLSKAEDAGNSIQYKMTLEVSAENGIFQNDDSYIKIISE